MVPTATPVSNTETILAHHAAAIHEAVRAYRKHTFSETIGLGQHLAECKKLLGHGKWLAWLKREFEWSEDTAERYINVASLDSQFPHMRNLSLPLRVAYALAATSTPDDVRAKIIERATAGEKVTVEDIDALKAKAKDRTYVAEHGTPELIAAVDRGELAVSEAKAFAHNYPPSQQDKFIMKGGPIADAVARANAAKDSKPAVWPVAQDDPGLFVDVKPISVPSDDQRKAALRLAGGNVLPFAPKTRSEPIKDSEPLTAIEGDVDITNVRFGAHAVYTALSTIDLAQTTPQDFWALFDTPNLKAGTVKWLNSSIKKLTEIKEGMQK